MTGDILTREEPFRPTGFVVDTGNSNNSKELFLLAQDPDNRDSRYIGSVMLEDDKLFKIIQVNLASHPNRDGSYLYAFDTILFKQDDANPFDSADYTKISEHMKSHGYECILDKTQGGKNQLLLIKNGRCIIVGDASLANPQAEIGLPDDEPSNPNTINVILIDPKVGKTTPFNTNSFRLKPLSEEEFPQDLAVYAQTLQYLVNYMYQARGFVAPDQTLFIKREFPPTSPDEFT